MRTNLFLDCEWNGQGGDLLSIALVSQYGDEWYEVVDTDGHIDIDEWVAENVIPHLGKSPIKLASVRSSLQQFLTNFSNGIHIIADWPEDIERLCSLLISGPGQRINTPPLTMEIVRIDCQSSIPHNALCDARGIRDSIDTQNSQLKIKLRKNVGFSHMNPTAQGVWDDCLLMVDASLAAEGIEVVYD